METTYTAINRLAHMFTQDINDRIFCSAIDSGIDPGIAWNATYDHDPNEFLLTTEVAEVTEFDTFEDVEFAPA